MSQADLFAESIKDRFDAFHAANPHVYRTLRAKALQVKRAGRTVGIATLFEVLRWDYLFSTEHTDFKLNNNFRSHYARLLMDNEPELKDFFEVRELRAA